MRERGPFVFIMQHWSATPDWAGETAFIVAGGTSVLDLDVASLRGRRVVAVNSSYEAVPFADYLFFADFRWYEDHKKRPAFQQFTGKIVTVNQRVAKLLLHVPDDRILHMKRVVPNTDPKLGALGPGLAKTPCKIVSHRTSLQGGMNLAAHLGASRLVLLGADMRRADDGRSHHHEKHRWRNKPGNATWDLQLEELGLAVEPLKQRAIEVVNTSLISRIPDEWGWRKLTLRGILNEIGNNTQAATLPR